MEYTQSEQRCIPSSFKKFRMLWKQQSIPESDGYITSNTVSDIRCTDAAFASCNKLRSSECESKRVSVRTWYAILSTYMWFCFYEVRTNFDTARIHGTNRLSLSPPVRSRANTRMLTANDSYVRQIPKCGVERYDTGSTTNNQRERSPSEKFGVFKRVKVIGAVAPVMAWLLFLRSRPLKF